MISLETLITFTFAAIILNLSPGPSNLYIMARSISQGVRGGIIAAFGLATGLMVHVILAALGVSAIFHHSPLVYSIIKLAGAFYLIYLGIQYWKTSGKSISLMRPRKKKSHPRIFRESMVVEITNPKTALFFLAFIPQFISPEAGSISLQILILGTIVTLSAIPCDVLVALTSTTVAAALSSQRNSHRLQYRLSGSILFGMGSFIIADEMFEQVDVNGQ